MILIVEILGWIEVPSFISFNCINNSLNSYLLNYNMGELEIDSPDFHLVTVPHLIRDFNLITTYN